MTKLLKERLQLLAGIISEGEVVSLGDYREKRDREEYFKKDVLVSPDGKMTSLPEDWAFAEVTNEEQMRAIIDGDLGLAEELGVEFYELEKGHKLVNKAVQESSSPEFAQDLASYFGTDDSVDGPYTKVSKIQPFDDNQSHKKDD